MWGDGEAAEAAAVALHCTRTHVRTRARKPRTHTHTHDAYARCAQVRQEVDTGVASVPDPVVQELITGLRMVTLETVEAIARWKQSRQATKPEGHDEFPAHPHCTFVYRQANYVLKIVSDVDFLENSPTIQRLYPSIQLYGNPFLSPAALADRPADLNLAVDSVLKAQVSSTRNHKFKFSKAITANTATATATATPPITITTAVAATITIANPSLLRL